MWRGAIVRQCRLLGDARSVQVNGPPGESVIGVAVMHSPSPGEELWRELESNCLNLRRVMHSPSPGEGLWCPSS